MLVLNEWGFCPPLTRPGVCLSALERGDIVGKGVGVCMGLGGWGGLGRRAGDLRKCVCLGTESPGITSRGKQMRRICSDTRYSTAGCDKTSQHRYLYL